MQNFAYKFIVFILTFFLIFNTASITHAHTYEKTDNVIKLDTQNSFLLKEDIKKILEQEKLDADTLNKNVDYDLSFIIGMQSLGITLVTYSTYPIVAIVLGILAMFSYQIPLISIVLLALIYILYPVLNSFFIYSVGVEKSKHSYLTTLYGSIVGSLIYIAIITTLVILDSYTITNLNIKDFQEIGIFFILPIFSSVTGSIFYYMDEKEEKSTPNEPIKASMTSEELMNKIKTQKGSFSFKIADF